MLAEMNPAACPISCPAFTRSPFFTVGMAGAPICWDRGIITCSGRGRTEMGACADNLFSGGCTPPILKVLSTVLYFSGFLIMFAVYASVVVASGVASVIFLAGKFTSWMACVGHALTHLRHRRHLLKSM